MMDNINSGADYAQALINSIKTIDSGLPINEQMDPMLMKCWIELVEENAETSYNEYIVGKRETFLLDEMEMVTLFKKATENYIQETLNNMIDKDLLEVSVGDNGDLLYGLSDKGREEATKLFGDEK